MANEKQFNTRIQNKHDFEVNWLKATNFVPKQGEIIIYDKEVLQNGSYTELPEGRTVPYTYSRFKIGDGFTNVNQLEFADSEFTHSCRIPEAESYSQERIIAINIGMSREPTPYSYYLNSLFDLSIVGLDSYGYWKIYGQGGHQRGEDGVHCVTEILRSPDVVLCPHLSTHTDGSAIYCTYYITMNSYSADGGIQAYLKESDLADDRIVDFWAECVDELPDFSQEPDGDSYPMIIKTPVEVVQETGASTTSIMSQKAVTDAIKDFADKDYVDVYAAAAENALTYLNNNKVDFDLVPTSTQQLTFNVNDEYFYEEHDNIVIQFFSTDIPAFKITVTAATSESAIIMPSTETTIGNLDIYAEYDTYGKALSYFIYCGEKIGAEVGGTITALIEYYGDSVYGASSYGVNLYTSGEKLTKVDPQAAKIEAKNNKLSLVHNGVSYPITTEIVNNSGYNDNYVMSQKATTEAVQEVKNKVLFPSDLIEISPYLQNETVSRSKTHTKFGPFEIHASDIKNVNFKVKGWSYGTIETQVVNIQSITYNLPDDVKILWLNLNLIANTDENKIYLDGTYEVRDEKYVEYDEPSNDWVSSIGGGIFYELDAFNNLSMFDCSTAPVEITGADAIYRRVMTDYLDSSLLPVSSRIVKQELDPIKAELKTLDQNIDEAIKKELDPVKAEVKALNQNMDEVWNEFEYVEEHSMSIDDNHNIQTPSNSTTGYGYTVTGIVIEPDNSATTIIRKGEDGSSLGGTVVGYELATTDGLEIGMKGVSIRLGLAKYNFGSIKNVFSDERIVLINGAPNNIRKLNNKNNDLAAGSVYNILTIMERPDLGDTPVSFYATAFGVGAVANEYGAVALGNGTHALGKNSLATGRNTVAGYDAFAQGWNSQALGDQSFASGHTTRAYANSSHTEGYHTETHGYASHAGGEDSMAFGSHSFAHGHGAYATGNKSIALGDHVEAVGNADIALGAYNEPYIDRNTSDETYLLSLGNGAEGALNNAFAVRRDGRVVAAAGQETNELSTVGQLNNQVTPLKNSYIDLQARLADKDLAGTIEIDANDSIFNLSSKGNGTYQVTGLKSGATIRNGHLIIPSKIGTQPISDIKYEAFKANNNITKITLGEGVQQISSRTFQNCKNLTEIVVPKSLTTLVKYAFENCTGLTRVELHENVTSIEATVFNGCTCDIYVPWSYGDIPNAPWGTRGTVHYNCGETSDNGNAITYSYALQDSYEASATSVPVNYTKVIDANTNKICYYGKVVLDFYGAGNICYINQLLELPHDVPCTIVTSGLNFANQELIARKTNLNEFNNTSNIAYIEIGNNNRGSSITSRGIVVVDIICTDKRCFVEASYKEIY